MGDAVYCSYCGYSNCYRFGENMQEENFIEGKTQIVWKMSRAER